MCCKRRSKYDKPDFFSGSTSTGQSDPEEILSEGKDVLSLNELFYMQIEFIFALVL